MAVINPHVPGQELSVTGIYFFLMIVSTALTAAGGYCINDYVDQATDRINKPNSPISGNHISAHKALSLYLQLTAGGLFAGIALALLLQSTSLLIFFICIPFILWGYSNYMKQKMIVGNFTVALLTGTSLLLPGWITIQPLQNSITPEDTMQVLLSTGFFACFATLLTLIREIAKDIEDLPGDKLTGCRTLPVVAGIRTTKVILLLLIGLTIATLLVYATQLFPDGNISGKIYLTITTIIPLLLISLLIARAHVPTHFKSISVYLKLSMLSGLSYAVMYHIQLTQLFI
jgi:4-hydroxybenzoate polyprenyltransferase